MRCVASVTVFCPGCVVLLPAVIHGGPTHRPDLLPTAGSRLEEAREYKAALASAYLCCLSRLHVFHREVSLFALMEYNGLQSFHLCHSCLLLSQWSKGCQPCYLITSQSPSAFTVCCLYIVSVSPFTVCYQFIVSDVSIHCLLSVYWVWCVSVHCLLSVHCVWCISINSLLSVYCVWCLHSLFAVCTLCLMCGFHNFLVMLTRSFLC